MISPTHAYQKLECSNYISAVEPAGWLDLQISRAGLLGTWNIYNYNYINFFQPFYSSSRISVDTRTGLWRITNHQNFKTAMISMYREWPLQAYTFWCHSVPFQDAVNNMAARTKVVNISSYIFIITKPSLQFLICTTSYKAVKEYVSDILYIDTRNMQWCSPLCSTSI